MSNSLRETAIEIWRAGVTAVDSETLVRNQVRLDDGVLNIAQHQFRVSDVGRLIVVGTGKAGAGMASAVESALAGTELFDRLAGWINVPADCVRRLERITLHAARPAGVNEPTEEGVAGAVRILELVSGLDEDDICIVLLSGGGSALLPAPVEGVSLADKQTVTRLLMHGGATINELNCVRKQLSEIKGGGLARAAENGTVISLIISDVIGDPLDVIASGPTVDDKSTAQEALAVLNRIVTDHSLIPLAVTKYLETQAAAGASRTPLDQSRIFNHVIGNNEHAVFACADKARSLGYRVQELGTGIEGVASEVGRDLADLCLSIRDRSQPVGPPVCILSGGEPIVRLAEPDRPRKGGRNQELVLAALDRLGDDDAHDIVILSGGTDGEDGPTDAAGAFLDTEVAAALRKQQLSPQPFLAINNSYEFFDKTGGLLKTGPTHTNVMDVRVALVGSLS